MLDLNRPCHRFIDNTEVYLIGVSCLLFKDTSNTSRFGGFSYHGE